MYGMHEVNCLDRHDSNKIALHWEPGNKESENLTYGYDTITTILCHVMYMLMS